MITRGNELRQLLENENIDILLVTETDTCKLESEEDYVLAVYKKLPAHFIFHYMKIIIKALRLRFLLINNSTTTTTTTVLKIKV